MLHIVPYIDLVADLVGFFLAKQNYYCTVNTILIQQNEKSKYAIN